MRVTPTPAARAWMLFGLGGMAAVAFVIWFVGGQPRVLASWHGFLHVAVANRFPSATLPPENPFLAGEPLPYYWFYQFLGAASARVLGLDLLHGLQVVTLAGLLVLVTACGMAGWRMDGTIGAGLLAGWLALAGVNPLGPLIAGAKGLTGAASLRDAAVVPAGSVFVTDAAADALMVAPVLGAAYFSGDWRLGQNLVWFLDVSSRGPALAMVAVLGLLLTRRRGAPAPAGMALGVGLLTAFSPLLGFAVPMAILAAACLPAVAGGSQAQETTGPPVRRAAAMAISSGVGWLIAFPTYWHLIGAGARQVELAAPAWAAVKLVALLLGFALLAPPAMGALAARGPASAAGTMAMAGALLLLAVPVVNVSEGNEHNLANAAACLLAMAAAAWRPRPGPGRWRGRYWRAVAGLLVLPMTIVTLAAFTGRPPLPIATASRQLERLPPDGPLARLYAWIRRDTLRSAVFVADPDRTVKMSGNVAELPAFTGRTLLVDQPHYLGVPADVHAFRAALARRLLEGRSPGAEGIAALRRLERPVYLVTYEADREGRMRPLVASYGNPVFRAGFVAVFAIVPARQARAAGQDAS